MIERGKTDMQKKQHRLKNNAYAYLLITPGLLMIGIILVFPLVRGILSGFFKQEINSLSLVEWNNFRNYKLLMDDPSFWMTLGNTGIWVLVVVSLQYLLGLGTALLLNKKYFGRSVARSLVLIPWVIPTIAGTLTWQWIFDYQYGLLNYLLRALGLQGINWLGSTQFSLVSCMITAIWKASPFVTMILLAALQSIDVQLYEAADIDGATVFQKFWSITLPGIKTVTITCLIMRTIWTFNQFDIVSIMTNGGPANSSMILPVYTYLTAFSFNQLNYAAAIACTGILLILPIAIAYIILNTREARGVKRV